MPDEKTKCTKSKTKIQTSIYQAKSINTLNENYIQISEFKKKTTYKKRKNQRVQLCNQEFYKEPKGSLVI